MQTWHVLHKTLSASGTVERPLPQGEAYGTGKLSRSSMQHQGRHCQSFCMHKFASDPARAL
jgi:hypothetical protein